MADESLTDEQLLRAFLTGEEAALEDLARRYERSLLGLARGLLGGDRALACDAVQETWMRVIRHGRKFAGRSTFKTWIYSIVVNHCRDLRERGRRGRTAAAAGALAAASVPDDEPVPDDQHEAVRVAVERLPSRQREVVVLCYHDGITCELAAALLNVPVGTVKSRLHAALTTLRAQLGAEQER